ncbi:endonuclease/exonuclease/phosphatase family protein [Flavobacterium lacus]|uniref:Endonuclease/exonuclease/phosphatase family metal-dependent hydrolase n=1 Tax=Flavobacterium lacus TaxID=1353778 RepID=A0A328WVD7_9FLAO|nr:endonuclease/exonuclease/phosphatase family protein [Flavobacterium lacus]RAR46839.1 endonuclease/exonuclease/phosphatase family metal-dependent hydrolase [Flavobacterium lacus]
MKNLGWFNKVILFFNIVLTILTFVAYILPFLAPRLFPILSVLTLFLPLMLILNLLFFGYWLIQFKRQMLLSGIVLLLGITFINKFYKFSETNLPIEEEDFIVMSYNVRLFNLYDWIERDVSLSISDFVKEQTPDILCIQEFSKRNEVDFRVYKHKYVFIEGKNTKLGQAIFSKYPIVNEGVIPFPNSTNNAIYADIKRGKDTIRVYSMHLQSIKITPDVHEIDENIQGVSQDQSKRMLRRMSTSFKSQQNQAEIIKKHKADCNYPIVICGDMNNSPFSFVYRSIKGDLNDAFEEAGSGFGTTYSFKYYPARIDYIFTDKKFVVKQFSSFPNFRNSDHFPIVTRLSFETEK